MPPPPEAITVKPAAMSATTAGNSTIFTGMGDGTTRRQPRPASSATFQPSASACERAVASSMNEPIGLLGFWKAGSFRSTRVWVMTVAVCFWIPSRRNSLRSACWNMYPMAPCVSAPQ